MNFVKKIIGLITSGNQRSVAVKKNIIGSFALKGISIVISFLLVPLTLGYVNSELYGVWLTLSSILTWLSFLDIGFTQGLKNKLTEALASQDYDRGKALVSTTYFMMVIIFVPVCLVCELLIPFVDWTSLLNVPISYRDEILHVMQILVVFACFQLIVNVLTSVIAAYQKVAFSTSFAVIGNFLSLLIILVLIKTCPPSLYALTFSYGLMPILVTFAASFILYHKKFKEISPNIRMINKSLVGDLFGLGYKFFIINVQVLVLYQSTNFLISNISSPVDVTSYNLSYKLMNITMMAYTIITAPLWPAYTDAYARGDYEWMKSMRNKMNKVLLLSILGCLLLVVFSVPFYKVWIGDKAQIPFQMTFSVALYVIAYCWMNLNGTLIVGMGKVKLDTIIAVVGMVIHIPLSLFLSKFIGVYGVLTSQIAINFFYAIILYKQVNMILNNKAFGIWLK